jgi:hypothetical protein
VAYLPEERGLYRRAGVLDTREPRAGRRPHSWPSSDSRRGEPSRCRRSRRGCSRRCSCAPRSSVALNC